MGTNMLADSLSAVSRNAPPFLAIVRGVLSSLQDSQKMELASMKDLKSRETRNGPNFGQFRSV